MINKKLKIIFLGTPEFASIILKKLLKSNYKPCLVITRPDKCSGRNQLLSFSSVKKVAIQEKIEIFQPDKINDCISEIKKINPDLAITVAYGQKIPLKILNIPKYGFINVHPSLLPLYRGPSPIRDVIKNDESETGVTIMLMNENIDSGQIISQEKIILNKKIRYLELSDKLALMGAELLIKTIPNWFDGKIKIKEQNHNNATYTKIVNKKDGLINWNLTAIEIERKVRALNPWPGTYSFFIDKKTGDKKMIKIMEVEVQKETDAGPFGPLGKVYMATNNQLAVKTKKDFLIIKKLQIENKNLMNVEDFLNGNISFIGTVLI
jgi:methionyl-tRNA formyltransferase